MFCYIVFGSLLHLRQQVLKQPYTQQVNCSLNFQVVKFEFLSVFQFFKSFRILERTKVFSDKSSCNLLCISRTFNGRECKKSLKRYGGISEITKDHTGSQKHVYSFQVERSINLTYTEIKRSMQDKNMETNKMTSLVRIDQINLQQNKTSNLSRQALAAHAIHQKLINLKKSHHGILSYISIAFQYKQSPVHYKSCFMYHFVLSLAT